MHDIIRSLTFEVDWQSQCDGVAVSAELSEFAQHELISELQRVLESWSPEQVVYIDRLDVQLQTSGDARWRGDLVQNLGRELSPLLRRELDEAAASRRQVPASRATTYRSSSAGFMAALEHYLESGGLPWFFSGGRGELERQAEQWVQASSAAGLWTSLSRWAGSKDAQRRWLRLLSTQGLARLLDVLLGVSEALLSDWQRDYERLAQWLRDEAGRDTARFAALLSQAQERRLPESLLLALLDEALRARGSTQLVASSAQVRARGILAFVNETAVGSSDRAPWRSSQDAEAFAASDSRALPHVVSAEFRGALRTLAKRTQPREPQAAVLLGGTPSPDTSGAVQPRPVELPQDELGSTLGRSSREAQFITDAGLILLGSYLRMFLGRLGLAEGDRIVDMAGALVAVQHLVTGSTEAPVEYELALTKLLCGFPLFDVPPPLPQVDNRTQREANDLLGSVIEHWSALRSTSVSGLREAFLQRPGKLGLTPAGCWLLQVEQRPYDMLLGSLPWSFQMIKLPWMERAIVTEWVH